MVNTAKMWKMRENGLKKFLVITSGLLITNYCNCSYIRCTIFPDFFALKVRNVYFTLELFFWSYVLPYLEWDDKN